MVGDPHTRACDVVPCDHHYILAHRDRTSECGSPMISSEMPASLRYAVLQHKRSVSKRNISYVAHGSFQQLPRDHPFLSFFCDSQYKRRPCRTEIFFARLSCSTHHLTMHPAVSYHLGAMPDASEGSSGNPEPEAQIPNIPPYLGRHKRHYPRPPPYVNPDPIDIPPSYASTDPEKGELPNYAQADQARRTDAKINAATGVLIFLNVVVWSAAYLVWYDRIGPLHQSVQDVMMDLPFL